MHAFLVLLVVATLIATSGAVVASLTGAGDDALPPAAWTVVCAVLALAAAARREALAFMLLAGNAVASVLFALAALALLPTDVGLAAYGALAPPLLVLAVAATDDEHQRV